MKISLFRLTGSLALMAVLFLSAQSLSAREITDMYGHRIKVPDKITTVFSFSPSITYMIYAIDPDMVAALNRAVPDSEKRYFKKSFCDLPVLGGSSGTGMRLNLEQLLNVGPDVIIAWGGDGAYDKKTAESIAALGIPVISVNVDGIKTYRDAFVFLGKLLKKEKRANRLAAYIEKSLNEVKSTVARIPAQKRVVVYYAARNDGLNTFCETSQHSELIPRAGGINPVKCTSGGFTGMVRYSLENIMLMDPDVIITMDPYFASETCRKKVWRDIKAVKAKRVYLSPRGPINWLDGPPSFMGVLGLQWMTGNFYPELYRKDMEKETARFTSLFFGLKLSQKEIKEILNRGMWRR